MKLKITDEELNGIFDESQKTDHNLCYFSFREAFWLAESFHQSKVDKLLQIVEMQRVALKFYADKNNWLRKVNGWRHDMIIKDLDDESLNDWEGRFSGKTARQSVTKSDKMLKELKLKNEGV